MPVMDGYTATEAIRNWERESGARTTPIVALTAYALKGDAQKSKEAGYSGHITKPLTKERLLETIQEFTVGLDSDPQNGRRSSHEKSVTKAKDVPVAPELRAMISDFLENRLKDIDAILAAIDDEDFEAIGFLGHNMKGLACGF